MLVPFVFNVIPEARLLHTDVLSVVLTTGCGSTVTVIFCDVNPVQPDALTPVTLYTTVNGPLVRLVNLSFNTALAVFPAPVTALPTAAVKDGATVMLLIV